MTSAIFHTIPLSSITVNRDERQRRVLTGIDDLADSIARLGLIHPPVVTRDHVLVVGERRVTACRQLGWDSIPVQYMEDLDPAALRAVELEENLKRVDIEWKDECRAVFEYHEIKAAEEPGWTQEKTADALGISAGLVTQRINVARELAAGNVRVEAARAFSVARGIIQRTAQRAAANETKVFTKAEGPARPAKAEIINASFLEWAPAYDGPKFNFIHCDLPYGIDADKFGAMGASGKHDSYSDSPDLYWSLVHCLIDNLDRIALPSCHLMFWYSMKFHQETIDAFREHTDFEIDSFPLIWHKSDNAGALPDPERGPRRTYETALFGARGDRRVVGAVANSVSAPTLRSERFHMSLKPEPVLSHFFRMFIDQHSRVLDPTAGSGGAIKLAESMGAEMALGLEINPEFAAMAQADLESRRKT